VPRKQILWTVTLFFGCSILFWAINKAAAGSGRAVSLGIQSAVLVAIVAAIVLVSRRRS
jgi:hypothetical protein